MANSETKTGKLCGLLVSEFDSHRYPTVGGGFTIDLSVALHGANFDANDLLDLLRSEGATFGAPVREPKSEAASCACHRAGRFR